jgi:predicted dehydrogenase
MTTTVQSLRFCLVGGGRAGRVHANSLTGHVPGVTVAAIVDASAETREKAVADFAVEHGFASLAEALDKVEFDAVVITTPTFTHAELAVAAAGAGKHVFLEKPMALALAECDQIIEACRRSDVRLQIGFMRRFQPEFKAAFDRIRGGEIGRPMIVKSLTHGPGLPPRWAWDINRSNGMLAEVNSHDFDCVRWLMGANPVRVYADIANFKGDARGVDVADFYDTAVVQLRFDGGGIGSISGVCPCEYGYDARVEIVGEKGLMQIGDMNGQAIVAVTSRDTGRVSPVYRTWPERFAWGYINEMRDFADCIRTGREPTASGADGRWALAGVLAATRSFREERPIDVSSIE